MVRFSHTAVSRLAFSVPLSLMFFVGTAGGQTTTLQVTAEQVFKNLKVLQKTPADSLNQGMHLISGALGVECEYCHVEMDFPSDNVAKKDIARDMLRMTADLNQRSFKGEQVVTCYTCHQGHAVPVGTPVLPVHGYAPEKKPESGLPSVAEILSKYVAALGGEQRMRKVTSRIITGQQDVPTGPGGVNALPAEITLYQMAPNLSVRVATAKGMTLMSGFDGKAAWTVDPRGRVSNAIALEQRREAINADFYEPLNIAASYIDLKVAGMETVGQKNTYVLEGQFAPGAPVRLYFDVNSGLLLRRTTAVPTPAGNSPYQEDFDDYRDAGSGVKYPYAIHLNPAGPRTDLTTHSTIQIQRIQENVTIEANRFNRPQSKERPR